MKHLYITGHLPSNKAPIAGQKISYNFLNSKRNKKNYIVLSFANLAEQDYENQQFMKSFYDFKIMYASSTERILNHFLGFRYPVKCSARFNKNRENIITEIIKCNEIGEVTLEFTSVFSFYRSIRSSFPDMTINLIAHDVSFQAMMRRQDFAKGIKKLFYYVEARRLKKFELSLFNSNNVIVLNNKDRDILLREGISDSNIFVQRPILDTWLQTVVRNGHRSHTILFVGALHRPENHVGLKWFIDNVFTKLKRSFPQCKLIIIGKGAPKSLIKYQSDSILFMGYVQDLKPIFSDIHVSISPVLFGAGIKIKTLEYIAAGIPTVSTVIGAEGIDSHELLSIADTKEEFHDSIAAIFNH